MINFNSNDCISLNKKTNLAEVIGEQYKYWSKINTDYVFIDAPTGSGKSYFITHQLYEWAYRRSRSIVMLVNRRILKEQITHDICEYNISEGIRKNKFFIFTYQELEELIKNQKIPKQIESCYYIVCDEAHYFLQDAMFNPDTYYSFKFIMDMLQDKLLIFMTATPTHIIDYIEDYRYDHYYIDKDVPKYSTPTLTINPKIYFFRDINELVTNINKGNFKGKWLIFVNSKKIGKEILSGLDSKFKEKQLFIDANYRKNGHNKEKEEVNKIIEESYSSKQIIICTSVLDNGINIKDAKLNNIVIITDNKIEFLQMLGRKRNIDSSTNLFLYTSNKTHFNYLKSYYLNLYNSLRKYHKINNFSILYFIKYQDLETEHLKNFYYQSGEFIKSNPLAIEEVRLRYIFCKRMVEELMEDDNAFIKEQFSWLNIQYQESDLYKYYIGYPEKEIQEIKDKLEKIYEEKKGIFSSNDNEISELKNFILNVAQICDRDFSTKDTSLKAIDKAFAKIHDLNFYALNKLDIKENKNTEESNSQPSYYELSINGKTKINIKKDITLESLREIVSKYDDLTDDCYAEITGSTVPEEFSGNASILKQLINMKMTKIDELQKYVLKIQNGHFQVSSRPEKS